ncbi:MAG TPA: aminotransferase class V-fold PLP-dependent enzyme, partial [Armatimonadota bacterium]|nr:aminotransferase class V-fold PLP-dependent enzyme [Armatimonadota bacterium]
MEVYLDHNATTPVRPEVAEAMMKASTADGTFGNPSSVHAVGRAARKALSLARISVAETLGAEPSNVTFTGCGSEAINLAIKGGYFAAGGGRQHIITTPVEHSAVLKTASWLESLGAEVTYVPVDATGMLDPAAVADAMRDNTAIVSIVHANNEVGTIQPSAE